MLDSEYWDSFYENDNNWGQPNTKILCLVKTLQEKFGTTKIRVLDLACGNGRYAVALAELGTKVDCIDFSPVAVNRLKAQARKHGLDNLISPYCCDVREFRIPPFNYHLVLASGLFEYLIEAELQKLIGDCQKGTVIEGANAFVWLLQHREAAKVFGECPHACGMVEDIYIHSRAWQIISWQADFKEDFHPLNKNDEPQWHKHYIGRLIATRVAE